MELFSIRIQRTFQLVSTAVNCTIFKTFTFYYIHDCIFMGFPAISSQTEQAG